MKIEFIDIWNLEKIQLLVKSPWQIHANNNCLIKVFLNDFVFRYVIQPSSMAAIPSSKTRWNIVRNTLLSKSSVSRSLSNPSTSSISPTSKSNGDLLKRTSSGSGELLAKGGDSVFVFPNKTKTRRKSSVARLSSVREPEKQDLLQSEVLQPEPGIPERPENFLPDPGLLERKVSRFTVHSASDA